MYQNITNENPYKTPMKIYPAVHYTMGGLWVDYNLMTTVKGLFSIGESNFSDHGANRLGASALMQGLADGYFVVPHTAMDFLAKEIPLMQDITDRPEFKEAEEKTKNEIAKRQADNTRRKTLNDQFQREIQKLLNKLSEVQRLEQILLAATNSSLQTGRGAYGEFKDYLNNASSSLPPNTEMKNARNRRNNT